MTKIKHINSLTSAKIFAKIKQIQILIHTAALYWLSISTSYMYETFPGSYHTKFHFHLTYRIDYCNIRHSPISSLTTPLYLDQLSYHTCEITHKRKFLW